MLLYFSSLSPPHHHRQPKSVLCEVSHFSTILVFLLQFFFLLPIFIHLISLESKYTLLIRLTSIVIRHRTDISTTYGTLCLPMCLVKLKNLETRKWKNGTIYIYILDDKLLLFLSFSHSEKNNQLNSMCADRNLVFLPYIMSVYVNCTNLCGDVDVFKK